VHFLETKCVMTLNLMHYNYVIYVYNYVLYRVDGRKRSKTLVWAQIFSSGLVRLDLASDSSKNTSLLRDCSLFIVQGRLRRNSTVLIFFRCPPLKTRKIFKAPPPPNRQNKNINIGPPLALYLYLEKQNSSSLFRETKIDNGDQ
jgi:hypothetical protein